MKNSPSTTSEPPKPEGPDASAPSGKIQVCPYCGETQPASERCRACAGLVEPFSRQATHNAMGPWFIRNPDRPFHPGCSYETLVTMIERGQVSKLSILRGPTTRQFWEVAKRVPGIAHLFGYCHHCDATVEPTDHGCHSCGVPFGAYLDRNFMGLPDVKPLPWEAGVDEEAMAEQTFRAAGGTDGGTGSSPVRSQDQSGGTVASPPTGSPGPQSGRLSAFATDAELKQAQSPSSAFANLPEPPLTDRTPRTEPVAPARPTPAQVQMPTPAEDISARSLRRQIRRHQQQGRWMLIMMILLGVALIATVFMLWSRSGGA